MSNRWRLVEPVPPEAQDRFSDFHPVVLQLLWQRGLCERADIEMFFDPNWEKHTHAPTLFTQMAPAVARVFLALESGESIVVHGDYDADGVCGSAVLVSTLRDLAKRMDFEPSTISSYLPHREKEGYGMSVETMERITEERGTSLVITVDCGISNKPAIDRGLELGVDTIVCDHHTMPAELPVSAILIHPLVPSETYPFKHLCGTGVAFKLASALILEAQRRGVDLPAGYEKWLLDLVAIATVTDVVPLTGENRVLETFGLLVLNKTKRPGLRKLLEMAGSKGTPDTTTIGFQIGPRLNAAGRMEHASLALDLLLAETEEEAHTFALALDEVNRARQVASEKMYQEAKAQVGDPGERKLLIVVGDGWSAGLVGLVASKLVNDFRRPVLVVGREGEKHVGSGRSIPGFDVTAAVRAGGAHLDKFGGHPQACGFSGMDRERFARATEAMQSYAEGVLTAEQLIPEIRIDADLPFEDASWELQKSLTKFEPFGEGNRSPIFGAHGLTVVSADPIGESGKHMRLTVRSAKGPTFRLIGFRFGEWISKLRPGQTVDVAYELGVNEWNGRKELQFKLVDIRV